MVITLFLKSKNAGDRDLKIDVELSEFKRLSADYTSYLTNGQPKHGFYNCRTIMGDPSIKAEQKIFIDFTNIAAIG